MKMHGEGDSRNEGVCYYTIKFKKKSYTFSSRDSAKYRNVFGCSKNSAKYQFLSLSYCIFFKQIAK